MSTTNTDIESIYTTTEAQFHYTIEDDSGEEEFGGSYFAEEQGKLRTEDFISRPYFSPNCDIEENILEFDFSYGYDCKKPYNLVVMDENTICFASGNLIHIFDVQTREIWFRRSALGGGIGHMTKNPNPDYPHLAIGENGHHPPIFIYLWPSMEIVCLLKGGTSRIYTHLNYSPTGDLLASQGGEPDYMITIWNWPRSMILLRTKSYVNDVLRIMFSPFVPGQLTSSGIAHIKFWKIAKTFTGLKLQGELGRFGKTEYSDIVGIFPMPDEKVISGCFWGNILVWDEGLIKLEVCRKNRKKCHDAAIVQFKYQNGELWTVSLDGHVKMWYYDTIDQADPPDEDRFCIMEPTYDFHTPGACFMCIEKQYPDPEDTFYFAQDAKGAIWRIDLNIEEDAEPSERLLKSHAGVTKGLAVCPWGPYFNTIGIGGWLHLYNYEQRRLLVILLFPAPGAAVIWVPLSVDPSGEVVILGFGDGTIRLGIWKINEEITKESEMHVIQIEKPHCKSVTCISMNDPGTLLVTGGEDQTIFVFQIVKPPKLYIKLVPIGYVPTPDVPSCLTWNNFNPYQIIVGCIHGQILTVELPKAPVNYTKITFILDVEPIIQNFHSYKSQIHRDKLLVEIEKKKAEKRAKKEEEMKKLRADNPGLDIDEEIFLADSESTETLPPLYIPEVPNKIFWIMHTEDNTIWLSMDGYDAGYIYEYKIGQTDPIPYKCVPVDGAENMVIGQYLYSSNREFLIFAMLDGSIRVNRVNKRDWHDLSNYWQLNMHDNYNGFVSGMSFTYDQSYFITCGHDGNVFTFRYYPDETDESTISKNKIARIIPEATYEYMDRVDCTNKLSLEQTIVKAEVDRINKVANENKAVYLDDIRYFREMYEDLLERNTHLPESQRLSAHDLEVDPRVTEHLEESLREELHLLNRKYEFKVEKSKLRMQKLRNHFIDCMDVYPIEVRGIQTDERLFTIKERILGTTFFSNLEEVDRQILENLRKGRPPERVAVTAIKPPPPTMPEKKLEYFLAGLSSDVLENKLGPKIKRLLAKYRARKDWKDKRKLEWEQFNQLKPADLSTDAEDEANLREAEETIGDFKLKSSLNYKVPKHLRESTYTKYKELLLVRQKGYNLVHDFNRSVYEMRDRKQKLFDYLTRKLNILSLIHEELLPEQRIYKNVMDDFENNDYPEKNLEVDVSLEPKSTDKGTPEIFWSGADMVQRAVLTIYLDDPLEHEQVTEWEKELQHRRYRTKLFEQDQIIKNIDRNIENFNEDLKRMRFKRVGVSVDSCLILLHLLTLNQELIVLKECEAKEDMLSEKVNQKLQEQMDVQDVFSDLSTRIEGYKTEIDRLEDVEKDISKSFYTAISDSKFYDFLRRIFRKKYKPPKVHTDDDSSSSSSSSSSEESEEEDAASIDSKDFGIIRLDESICPKGCDLNTYEMTFQLRAQRHQVEHEIKDLQYLIEVTAKSKEQTAKKVIQVDKNLKQAQDELEEYQREKQQKLNKIMCTVVLKADQIKNLKETEESASFNYIKDSLVFSQKTLSKLYHRVSELDNEKNQQLEKHKLSIIHLKRMEVDFSLMRMILGNLRRDIKDALVKKFGSNAVDINEVEEYMLKKMIFDLRLSLADIKGFFDLEVKELYGQYKDNQKALMTILRKNTLGQELLSLLRYERAELTKVIDHQGTIKKNIDNILKMAQDMTGNIKKLEKVVKEQAKEIEMLKNEIRIYKTKGFRKPEKKLQTYVIPKDEAEDQESVVSEWCDIDDYMYTETYAKEYWARKKADEERKTRQQVILGIMDDLFKNIQIELHRNLVLDLLKTAFSAILNKSDVKEIINDMLNAIPSSSALNDQQISLVELTAEKLYSIEEIDEETTDDGEEFSSMKERLIECTSDILDQELQSPAEVIEAVVHALLESFPLHDLIEPGNLDCVVDKITTRHPELSSTHLHMGLMDFIDTKTFEARLILAEILDRIFNQASVESDIANLIF